MCSCVVGRCAIVLHILSRMHLLHHPGLSPAQTPLPSIPYLGRTSFFPAPRRRQPRRCSSSTRTRPTREDVTTWSRSRTTRPCQRRQSCTPTPTPACTILCYISTCASDCTVTSGPTCGALHASVCFAPLYLPCICITITTSAYVRTFFTR